MDSRQTTIEEKKCNNFIKTFLIGSLSGTCSTLLFQPLDVVKTRLQTRNHGNVGMFLTFHRVIQKDGVRGLWKGTTPALLRTVPGVGMYFTVLHYLGGFWKTTPSSFEAACIGFVTRCSVGAVLLPFQVLKTRFESGQYQYKNLIHAGKTIWRSEGTPGFYRGLLATLARDAPFSSLYLMFFIKIKTTVKNCFNILELNPEQRFTCGLLAGILAAIATHPPDVLKTKLQLNPKEFKRTLHTLQHTVEIDGIFGLFRGLVPRLYRRSLIAAMTWTFYEEVMQALGLKSEKQFS